jgi:hypothetical protein
MKRVVTGQKNYRCLKCGCRVRGPFHEC